MTRQAARRIAAWSGAAVLAVAVTACGSGAGGEASFRLDVAPDPVAIVQGGAQAVEVTIDRPAEFTAPVALSLTGAPDGIEGAFDPGPATGTDSTLMLTVAADTPTGEHRVSVRGAADGATASAGLTVDVVEAAPPSTIEVDSDLTPDAPDLPPFEDGEPRPVTTLTDDSGVLAHFVANELVVVADDEAELNALLDRHDGTLLATIDLGAEPSTADATPLASDVPTMHLVRVEAAPADADLLIEDLRTIRPDARSDLVVGSDAGLNLLAAAAQEAIAGLSVAVNWVGESHGFTDGVSNEAPVVEDSDGRYDSPNVFDWSYMGAEQLGIGVAQAWWALEASGKLDEVVRIAILDGGFLDNDDVPSGWTAVSVVSGAAPIGSPNPATCTNGNPCPWHGTGVAWAAAAVPDNDFGTAGPAGPVAEMILIHTSPDMFQAMHALSVAADHGADIANMSFGSRVPASIAWTVYPFEAYTAAFRSAGRLLFSSAGNVGEDVDEEQCFVFCWEKAWHTPCENIGVLCVGGTGMETKAKAGNSNYGLDDVDIFAPYWLFAPANVVDPSDHVIGVTAGTSLSSPFAAGVAALIWAADRSQSADQVQHALLATAHTTADPLAPRYVNALGGVMSVLGGVGPTVTITDPFGDVTAGVFTTFSAIVNDLEDGLDCCIPTWTSDLDGVLGTGNDFLGGLSPGTHLITATATDSDGNTGSDSRSVTAINHPPSVTVAYPPHGAELASDKIWTFAADVSDPNELDFDCGAVAWTSDHPDDPDLFGCTPMVAFDQLGPRTWTVTATDAWGASGSAVVSVDVTAGPALWISIVDPKPGAYVWPGEEIALSARVSDAFELPATFAWAVSTDGVDYETVATGTVETDRLGDPWVPTTHWEVPFAYMGDELDLRLVVDADNGTVATLLAIPITVNEVPH